MVAYRILRSDLSDACVSLDSETGMLTVQDFNQLLPGRQYKLQVEAHGEEWLGVMVMEVMMIIEVALTGPDDSVTEEGPWLL